MHRNCKKFLLRSDDNSFICLPRKHVMMEYRKMHIVTVKSIGLNLYAIQVIEGSHVKTTTVRYIPLG